MNRQGHENVNFFIGSEVEHTPALNKKTLFVVGVPSTAEITQLANQHKITNIYLGANQSFNQSKIEQFSHLLDELIGQGFTVTLDFEATDYALVVSKLPKSVLSSRYFIPMISVALPSIESMNSNTTLKIDDVDFAATNSGVWCHNINSLLDNNRFTPWGEYESDKVISTVATAVVKTPVVESKPTEVKQDAPVVNARKESTPNAVVTKNTSETPVDKKQYEGVAKSVKPKVEASESKPIVKDAPKVENTKGVAETAKPEINTETE